MNQPNNYLILKDNTSYTDKENSDILEKISGKTLANLQEEGVFVFPDVLSDSDDLEKEQKILEKQNKGYITGNVAGFLGFHDERKGIDERIVIKSRFDEDSNDYFLQYLLEKALGLPNVINLETGANQEAKLFNLLVLLFPKYLKQATRKGLFKTYIRKNYNDGNVRGTIDVATHIRKNTPFVGNISYSQREISYDNYLTELIRHTIEFIKGKEYGRRVLNSVKEEIRLVSEATPNYKASDRRKIIESNRKNVVRHAFYHEYLTLQKLCIQILKNEKHQYGNDERKVYGILFDVATLWEEYVNTLIGEYFDHPKNKKREGTQYLFYPEVEKIYPDFIGKDKTNCLIADAKYKPLRNIDRDDIYQILAYMFRFDAKKGFFLYPRSNNDKDDKGDLTLNLNRGYGKNVKPRKDAVLVIKHGLEIPQGANNYHKFAEEMDDSEKKFMEAFDIC